VAWSGSGRDRGRDLDHARDVAVPLERGDPLGARAEPLIGRLREDEMPVDHVHGMEAESFGVQLVQGLERALGQHAPVIDRFGPERASDREARHGGCR
jgi:hypothetical protein